MIARPSLALALCCAMLPAGHAVMAEVTHYDVFVTGSGASLIIGGFDDSATLATIPPDQMRVFGGEVTGTGSASPYESTSPGEPGFRAATQSFLNNPALTNPAGAFTALPGGVDLVFSFLPIDIGATSRNLFFWNGAGAVAFSPVSGDVTLDLTKQGVGGWMVGISGTSAATLAGNTIQKTTTGASAGTVHTHLFTSIAKGGAAPEQGFYLYSLGLSMAGFSPSASVYFVYGALDPTDLAPQFADLTAFETAHGAAEAWVEANVVPEPAGMAGMAFMGLICGRRLFRSRSIGPAR